MPIHKQLNKGRVPVKVYTDDIDSRSIEQLTNMASLPIIHSHIAAMPDVHAGIGAPVGSVIPTLGAVIPAAVGWFRLAWKFCEEREDGQRLTRGGDCVFAS